MPDTEPIRRLDLPRYDASLTLERSEMYPKTPYVIMGELHGVRYPERFCSTEQEAQNYLDQIRRLYEQEEAERECRKR